MQNVNDLGGLGFTLMVYHCNHVFYGGIKGFIQPLLHSCSSNWRYCF